MVLLKQSIKSRNGNVSIVLVMSIMLVSVVILASKMLFTEFSMLRTEIKYRQISSMAADIITCALAHEKESGQELTKYEFVEGDLKPGVMPLYISVTPTFNKDLAIRLLEVKVTDNDQFNTILRQLKQTYDNEL